MEQPNAPAAVRSSMRCTGIYENDLASCQDECDRLNPGNHGVWMCYANCSQDPCTGASKVPNDLVLIAGAALAIRALVSGGASNSLRVIDQTWEAQCLARATGNFLLQELECSEDHQIRVRGCLAILDPVTMGHCLDTSALLAAACHARAAAEYAAARAACSSGR
jgi:hypothetical protein